MLLGKAFMLEGDPTPHFVRSVLGFQAVRCTLNTCYFVRKSKTFHLSDFNEKHDKRAIKQTNKTTNYVCKDDGACAWHKQYFIFFKEMQMVKVRKLKMKQYTVIARSKSV